MSLLAEYAKSTIGRKTLMGLTGLGLCLFVLIHMAGNLLLFVSPEKFNHYGDALSTNPLLPVAEIGLIVFFVGHIVVAFFVTLTNRRAHRTAYAVKPPKSRDATLASKTLIYSGLVILAFLILHLITFKFGTVYKVTYGTTEMRDLYKLVTEIFHNPLMVGWYVISLVILGFHLSHALSASFQTLGLLSSRDVLLRRISVTYALVVCTGFTAEAVGVLLGGIK